MKIISLIFFLILAEQNAFAAAANEVIPFAKIPSRESQWLLPVGRLSSGTYLDFEQCSATLVGPKIAVTARHCVTDIQSGRFVRDIPHTSVVMTLDNGKKSEVVNIVLSDYGLFPIGRQMGTSWIPANLHRDFAILELREDLGTQAGYFPIDFSDPFETPGENTYKIVGYPVSFWLQSSTKNISSQSCFVSRADSFDDGQPFPVTLVSTNCLVAPGFSGGPLLKFAPDGKIVVIGVTSAPLGKKASSVGSIIVPAYNQTWIRNYFGQ